MFNRYKGKVSPGIVWVKINSKVVKSNMKLSNKHLNIFKKECKKWIDILKLDK